MSSVNFLRDNESIRKEAELRMSNCFKQAKTRYPNEDEGYLNSMCFDYKSIMKSKVKCLDETNTAEKVLLPL